MSEAGGSMESILKLRTLTDQKQTQETQARIAVITESSQDAIIGKDFTGILTSWDPAAETIISPKE